MVTLYDALAPDDKCRLAVRLNSPAALARIVVAEVGSFGHNLRRDYDRFLRRLSDAYAECDREALRPVTPAAGRRTVRELSYALEFRDQVDRRLRDRGVEPVRWEVNR
jgi:hypothetical protein